jgi:hypothetical protein
MILVGIFLSFFILRKNTNCHTETVTPARIDMLQHKKDNQHELLCTPYSQPANHLGLIIGIPRSFQTQKIKRAAPLWISILELIS